MQLRVTKINMTFSWDIPWVVDSSFSDLRLSLNDDCILSKIIILFWIDHFETSMVSAKCGHVFKYDFVNNVRIYSQNYDTQKHSPGEGLLDFRSTNVFRLPVSESHALALPTTLVIISPSVYPTRGVTMNFVVRHLGGLPDGPASFT